MRTPDDVAGSPVELGDVALFPLPNVVLFPAAVLPLHVFEERYKVMTAAALRGDRRITMALLRPGWEQSYHAHPAIDPVVCVGRILNAERLPDGRYNFLLQGEARAVVLGERIDEGGGFRIASLARLTETDVTEDDLADARRSLHRLFLRTKLGLTAVGQKFRELMAGGLPTPTLADLVAATYLEDVRLKQSLLAEQDVACRISRVVEELEATQPVCQSACLGDFANPTLN